jgi:hypothetical protein
MNVELVNEIARRAAKLRRRDGATPVDHFVAALDREELLHIVAELLTHKYDAEMRELGVRPAALSALPRELEIFVEAFPQQANARR